MRTSSVRCLLIALWLPALLAGCTPAAAPASTAAPANSTPAPAMTPAPGWLLHQDAASRYTVHYPAGWVVTSGEDAASTTHFLNLAVANQADRAGISVVVQGAAQALTTVATTARQTIAEQPNVSNFTLADEQAVEVNGLPGLRQTLRYELAGQAMVQQLVYLEHWRYTFALSILVTEENLATYSPTFEQFVQNFQAR